MPQLIHLYDNIPYEIPDFKGKETEIINHQIKDKSEQFWTKQPIPDFSKASAKTVMDWIWQEEKRLREGCWFLNNGELTYINAKHYEFLQYYTGNFENKNHADYWDFHRLYFYFLEYSDDDPFNVGDFTIKPRRSGITQIHNSETIRAARMGFGRNIGLMSATSIKAKKVQFLPTRNALARYPKVFRPKFKKQGKKLLENSLDLINEDYENMDEGLNSSIYFNAPESTSFDGEKLFKLKVDEVLKFEGKGFMDILAPQLKTMYLPHLNKIIGKASLFSTMGTNDKTMRYSINEGRKLWDGSNHEEADLATGRTQSGFIRAFISCLDTLALDKYGKSNRDEADKIQTAKIKQIIDKNGEGSIEHITELREMPRTINDVFDSPKLGTLFNATGRISERERIVVNTPPKARGYICGKFIENLRGEIYYDTSEEYQKDWWKLSLTVIQKPNNIRKFGGIFALPRNPETSIGYDPVKLDEHISDHISQPGALIYKKFDHYSKSGIENKIIGILNSRKEDNDEISEQVGFAARYFGALIVPERNVGDKWFKNNGYKEMVFTSPYDGLKGIYIGTGKARKPLIDGIELINDFLKKPKHPEDIDNLEDIFFEELLDEWKTFEADALNTHDLIAANIQAFLGAKSLQGTVLNGNGKVPTATVFW